MALWLIATTASAQPPKREGSIDSYLGNPTMDMQQVFVDQRFPNVVVTLEGTVLATWGNRNVQVGAGHRRSRAGAR